MWRSDAHLAHEKPKAASVTWLPYTLIDQVLAAVDTQERFLIRASVSSQRMADRDFQPHKLRAKIRPVNFCFPILANHGGPTVSRPFILFARPSIGTSLQLQSFTGYCVYSNVVRTFAGAYVRRSERPQVSWFVCPNISTSVRLQVRTFVGAYFVRSEVRTPAGFFVHTSERPQVSWFACPNIGTSARPQVRMFAGPYVRKSVRP
ncbi:hypothetical protein BKA93DRAFT_442997 [Sparassis latifolia]